MAVVDRVLSIVEPLLAERSIELHDLEFTGSQLNITLETADLALITEATRAISNALDEHEPISDHYTLQVSSPGLERPLRTPRHFTNAVGSQVTVKTVAGTEGDRRAAGTLLAADGDGITIELAGGEGTRVLGYDQIDRARTVFEWGAAPKPNAKPRSTSQKKATA